MSDQDTPPPMDDNTPNEGTPPPMESTPPAQPADSIPTAAPSTAGVALGQGTLPETDEKTMSMLAHILGGVTCILGPLILWLLKKDESPFVNDQGKEALNFQITVAIGYVLASILSVIPVIGCVAALLFPAVGIAGLVFGILGGLEANKGVVYRYPFALRLVS